MTGVFLLVFFQIFFSKCFPDSELIFFSKVFWALSRIFYGFSFWFCWCFLNYSMGLVRFSGIIYLAFSLSSLSLLTAVPSDTTRKKRASCIIVLTLGFKTKAV